MSRIDLVERLSHMVKTADIDSASQQSIIARQHAAKGMLQSGNFFIKEDHALRTIYENTLLMMSDYALNVAAPGVASAAVNTAGLELEAKSIARLKGILSGSASGNACDPRAAEKLLSDFRGFARSRLLQVVSDTQKNANGKSVRGWQGWVIRYGWNVVNSAIALAALYVAWIKQS